MGTDARVSPDPAGGYYVFWSQGRAFGARGSKLTKAAAEKLAERIREDGPNAL